MQDETPMDKGAKRTVSTFPDMEAPAGNFQELFIKNQVFENSIAAQSVANKDGLITHCNRAFLDVWGYPSKEAAIGKNVGSFFYNPEDAGPVLHALAEHDEWEGEFRAQKADGTPFISKGYATALRNGAGELIGYQSTNLDITGSHENVEKLARSKRELEIRNRIAEIFLTVSDDEMYLEVLNLILEVFESPFGVFGYIDEAGALVVPTMTRHIWSRCQVPDKTIVFPKESWGNSIWPTAIRAKEIRYNNERSKLTPKGHIPVDRNIAAPIVYQDTVIGLFQAANKPIDYDEEDLGMAKTLADAIAPILHARLSREREQRHRRETEEKMRMTLESIGDGVISVDTEGRVTQLNRTAESLTGWKENEAVGCPLSEVFNIVNEMTGAVAPSPVERVLETGKIEGLANHTVLIAKDGTRRAIADSAAPIFNDGGNIVGVVLVFRDQSNDRKARRALEEAETRFRTFFDNAPIGKCMTSPNGEMLRVNPAFCKILGYSSKEMETLSFVEITHPEDVEESKACVRSLLADKQNTWKMEKRYFSKQGDIVWTDVSTRLQRNDAGEPLYFLTHIQDITEKKQQEFALRERMKELRCLYAISDSVRKAARPESVFQDAVNAIPSGWKYPDIASARIVCDGKVFESRNFKETRWKQQTNIVAGGKTRGGIEVCYLEARPDSDLDPFLYEEEALLAAIGRILSELLEKVEAEAEYEDLYQNAPDMLVSVNANTGLVERCNETFIEKTGYTREEIVGRPVFERYHASCIDEAKNAFDTFSATGEVKNAVLRLDRKNASPLDVSLNVASVRDASGNIVAYRLSWRDISEQLHAQEEFSTIFKMSLNPICIADLKTAAFKRVNPAFSTVLGYTEAELLGQPFLSFIHPDDVQPTLNIIEEKLKAGEEVIHFENRYRHKNGEYRWLDWVSNPSIEKGVTYATAYDVTERKIAEQALLEATENLSRSNKELEQFAYVASHDLQEPLRMVASYTELLSQRYAGTLDEKADKYIGYAVDGAKRMQALINDLLTLSRVGTRGNPFEHTDCNDVVAEVLHGIDHLIKENDAVVTVEKLPIVLADRGQLRQVFQNLITNGIKFRGETPPIIGISAIQIDNKWEFAVQDNGIGIEPEFHERVFVIFQRLHERGKYPGTGMGLAIVKKIVERHGGGVMLESKSGFGSVFKFTLPTVDKD